MFLFGLILGVIAGYVLGFFGRRVYAAVWAKRPVFTRTGDVLTCAWRGTTFHGLVMPGGSLNEWTIVADDGRTIWSFERSDLVAHFNIWTAQQKASKCDDCSTPASSS